MYSPAAATVNGRALKALQGMVLVPPNGCCDSPVKPCKAELPSGE